MFFRTFRIFSEPAERFDGTQVLVRKTTNVALSQVQVRFQNGVTADVVAFDRKIILRKRNTGSAFLKNSPSAVSTIEMIYGARVPQSISSKLATYTPEHGDYSCSDGYKTKQPFLWK